MVMNRLRRSSSRDIEDARRYDGWAFDDSNALNALLNRRQPQSDRVSTRVIDWIQHKVTTVLFGQSYRRGKAISRQRTVRLSAIFRPRGRRLLLRWLALGWCLLFAVSLCQAILRPSYTNPPKHYHTLRERVVSSDKPGRGNVHNERVFIAANILNEDLIRGAWGESLLNLIDLLGHNNVFVSIYDNDSGAGTRDALLQLQRKFRCRSSVIAGDHVPLELFPTVRLPNGEERVQRLTYLAEIRNRLLRPLDPSFANFRAPGFVSVASVKFDKILFLNDVYFSSLEAVQLLFSTNAQSGKAKYGAACALDFVQLFKVYDTFVVRDTDGYQMSLQYYPWFTHLGSATSRNDALRQSDAVRVRSCWGGMAAFDAALFQTSTPPPEVAKSPQKDSIGLPYLPLEFRSGGEPFWEAAECCLIFADIMRQYGEDTAIYVNPYISTAYSRSTWNWVRKIRRFERIFQYYQYWWSLIKSPEFNQRRTHEPGQVVSEIVWVDAKSRLRDYAVVDGQSRSRNLVGKWWTSAKQTSTGGQFTTLRRKAEVGGFCGQRRFFVMKRDVAAANSDGRGTNWEKIPIPAGADS